MWCKGFLVAILLIMLGGAVVGGVAVRNLGQFLDVSEEVTGADAIVVMGGEGGKYMRTQHALELYHRGVAPRVVFSGGTLLGAGIDCSSTALSLDAAEILGLPLEAVVVAGEAQSTLDEAENLARLARSGEWQSLALVTDSFHTRRSLLTLQNEMPELVIVASAPEDERFDAKRWWSTEHGLVFAINEALKLAFYWREYGINPFG